MIFIIAAFTYLLASCANKLHLKFWNFMRNPKTF